MARFPRHIKRRRRGSRRRATGVDLGGLNVANKTFQTTSKLTCTILEKTLLFYG
jgi:hypothetical protein